jgi:hypothetical protein
MDTAQQIVTRLAQGDFAAVEQRLAGFIKPLVYDGRTHCGGPWATGAGSGRDRRGTIPLGSTQQDGSTTIGYDPNVVANHERRIGTTCFACMAWM